MNYKVNTEIKTSEKKMSDVYLETMLEIAEDNKKLVVLGADLNRSVGIMPFKDQYPDRYYDVGIAEANMIGISAGMSIRGYVPFAHTFAPFIRRCLDQIYLSGAYSKLNIKIVGANPGIMAAVTGGTHMPFDDIADCVAIPEMTVIEPSDNEQLRNLLPKIADSYGMCYIRFDRGNSASYYESGSDFEIGKAARLREGSDVTIIATGALMVGQALIASYKLKEKGVSARVLDMYTVKPIDRAAIIEAAAETGAIVTAENANATFGMGALVATVLAAEKNVPLECIGSQDQFGEVGLPPYLMQRFKLTADDIAAAAEKAILRKNQ